MNLPKAVVAAFDFDGTITYHDSLFPFLTVTFGRWRTFIGLGCLAPFLMADWLRGKGRQIMKERVLSYFMRGLPYERMRREGNNFAQCMVSTLVKPEALRRLRWHQSQGHRCVLISASINLYIEPWGREVGFDEILCSQVEVDGQGLLTGKLNGANCRAHEKVRRLTDCLGSKEQYELYAYGDSAGDKELLELADHAYLKEMPNE